MIEQFMKTNDYLRLSAGDRWLYWEGEWVVRSHTHGSHKTIVEYSGESLKEALATLIKTTVGDE
jgi:hypothetical protein